jgi:PAS domain S-box-containing protein
VSVNERLAAVNNRTVAEHLGRNVSEITPEFYDQIEPYLHRALSGEAIYDLEVRVPGNSPGAPERTMFATYQPARDEGGEVIGVSVAVMDLTTHQKVQLAACNDNACLKTVLHAIADGLIVVGAEDGRIIAANQQAEELLGRCLPAGNALDPSDTWTAFDPDGRRLDLRAKLLASVFLLGEQLDGEDVLYERPDGRWSWLRLSMRPIRASNEARVWVIVTLRDIGDYKRGSSAALGLPNIPDDQVLLSASAECRPDSAPINEAARPRPRRSVVSISSVKDGAV